jgi:hypothetical protein
MDPLVEMQDTTQPTTSEEIDRLRLRYGFWIIIPQCSFGARIKESKTLLLQCIGLGLAVLNSFLICRPAR